MQFGFLFTEYIYLCSFVGLGFGLDLHFVRVTVRVRSRARSRARARVRRILNVRFRVRYVRFSRTEISGNRKLERRILE